MYNGITKMNSVVCFFVLIGAVFVSAYDFSDSEFNKIFLDDLEASYDDVSNINLHYRKRRDADKPECKRRFHQSCCGEKDDFKIDDQHMDMKKACFEELKNNRTGKKEDMPMDPFSCEAMKEFKKNLVCVIQCVGQKKEVLDESGNIKNEEMKKSIDELFATEEWKKPIIDAAYAKCVPEATAAAEKAMTEKNMECNPAGLKLAHCMWREMLQNCPADKQKNDPKCQKLREKLSKGVEDLADFKSGEEH